MPSEHWPSTETRSWLYLRARWYDATTGRFNRLDPFFGNLTDPQSLHKYAYVHGDPIQGIDPTGEFFGIAAIGVGALLGNVALRGFSGGASLGALWWVGATIAGGGAGFLLYSQVITWIYGYRPIWQDSAIGGEYPQKGEYTFNSEWESNVYRELERIVDDTPYLTSSQRQNALDAADEISKRYVESVRLRAVAEFDLRSSDNVNFGIGGNWAGWPGNFVEGVTNPLQGAANSDVNCHAWTCYLKEDFGNAVNNEFNDSGWYFRTHRNTQKNGDVVLGLAAAHNYSSLTFDPDKDSTRSGFFLPSIILDPWPNARPDIYRFEDVNRVWPIHSGTSDTY